MNKKQIQLQICKALVDCNRRLCGAKINDDEVMITTDGFCAFVLFEKECIFDFNKIPEKNNIAKYIETNDKDEEVFITNKRFISGDTTLVKLQGETYTVYASEKYVKIFREYHLFADNNNSRIVAKNDFGMVIGMFCPMRYFEES